VIAKSYEMKAAGVRTGVPIWDAVKLCPSGVYLTRDFRWYEVLSRRMLEVVCEFAVCKAEGLSESPALFCSTA